MRKFAFDTSFDEPDARKQAEVTKALAAAEADLALAAAQEPEVELPPTFSADELEAARAVAWSDGMAAGRDEAEAGLLARQNRMLEGVSGRLAQLLAVADAVRAGLEQDAVRVGVAVVQALYPHSFREEARLEIVNAVRDVLQAQENTTTPLQLTIAADDQDWLVPVIDGLGNQRFRIRVQENMTAGDFRLEWADGGIERQQAQIWERIAALLPDRNTNDKDAPHGNHPDGNHKERNQ